jgi:ActR/RegA family two-component response regulator
MILQELPSILLLEKDAVVATRLVLLLEKAGADVVTADHAVQALQRLAQFRFAGAVIDYWHGASDRTMVAERLLELGVPLVVRAFADPPAAWRAVCAANPDQIVAAVMRLAQKPRTL